MPCSQEFTLKSINIVHNYGFAPLINLFPFFTLLSCGLVIGSCFPDATASDIRSCMLLFGCLFVELVTALMLAHMTESRLRNRRIILVPLVLLAVAGQVGLVPDGELAHKYILSYLSFAVTFVFFKFTVVIVEITECLGIYCFDITTKRKDKVEYVAGRVTRSNGRKRE